MKVRWLPRDPSQKPRDLRLRAQHRKVRIASRQLCVAQRRMDRPVANRVDRHRLAPAFALGTGGATPPSPPAAEAHSAQVSGTARSTRSAAATSPAFRFTRPTMRPIWEARPHKKTGSGIAAEPRSFTPTGSVRDQKCATTPAIGRKECALSKVETSIRRRRPELPVRPPRPMSFGPTSAPTP